eukprot:5802493-Amphidinium_carterae.1
MSDGGDERHTGERMEARMEDIGRKGSKGKKGEGRNAITLVMNFALTDVSPACSIHHWERN